MLLAGAALLAGELAGCRARPPTVDSSAATVSGRAADATGHPVANASVELTTNPPDGRVPMGAARTSQAGAFRIERVPVGRLRVTARARGFVDAVAVVDVAASRDARVELTLARTVAFAGRIEDGRGARVPLARVLAFAVAKPDASSAPQLHECRADERGEFRLEGLAPGAHRLLIEAPGLGSASAGPLIAPDAHVVVIMPGETRAIVGRVSRADRAIAGARVLLGGDAVPEPRTEQTDRDGRFAFGGLGPGAYMLRAEAGGMVGPVLTQVVVERVQRQARSVEIVLGAGRFVRGRVVGEDGRGVDGASVQIDLVPATGLWPAVKVDARGDWTSPPLAPGTYRVRAARAGFVARRTATVEVGKADVASSSEPAPVVLELLRTGAIVGRVVDERGRPLAGAAVSDRLAETEELGVIWSPLPLAAEAASLTGNLASVASFAGKDRGVTTGDDGRFALLDVPPGRARLEILHAWSIPLRTATLTVAPGATLDLGTLSVDGAIAIAGVVVDAQGSPLAGVRVGAARARPSTIGTDAEAGLYAVTDGSGAFSLPLAAGDHRVTARAPGRPDVEVTVHVAPAGAAGAAPARITLRMAGVGAGSVGGSVVGSVAGTRAIEGLVRDSGGRPLSRARIAVRATGAPTADATAALASAVADVGGHFRVTGLPSTPAQLSIEVRHPGYPLTRRPLAMDPATTSLLVEVPVPGGIEGEVHETISGAPVPGFEITAAGPDGAAARYPESGRAGKARARGPLGFSLAPLAPGRWTLRVRAPGYQDTERALDVSAASAPGELSLRDLRVEMERR